MKLLFSSLLLASLCALSSWSVSSSDPLVVSQSPDVSVMEGETVHITCCWTGEFERMSLNWQKNLTNIKTEIFLKNSSQGSLQKETPVCTNLTFTKTTREDSGRYACKLSVEIPFFITVIGNGTVITVMARNDSTEDNTTGEGHPSPTSNSLPFPVIISLAVVVPLFLITLGCFCTLRRTQGAAQAPMVIYEVPHIDSEEAEMDKHSTGSSRGSSQWCQVTVYESFDYFERVQTKESG